MKTLILIFAICLTSLSGCVSRGSRDVVQMPEDLFFVIKKNGKILDDNTLNNMKFYYFKDGTQFYNFPNAGAGSVLGRYSSDISLGVQTIPFPIALESINGVKYYYLEHPNGEIDTLYVDYQKLDHDQAIKDPCYCYFKLVEIKFNGVRASYDPEMKNTNIYRFDKLN